MKLIGFIYAISAAVAWGLVYAIDQKILIKASPLAVLFVYYILGTLMMLPFAYADWGTLKHTLMNERTTVLLIIGTSILATAANFFILISIQKIGAPIASVMEIAYPFFVVLFAAMMFGSSVNLAFWLGGVLMFAGATIILRWS